MKTVGSPHRPDLSHALVGALLACAACGDNAAQPIDADHFPRSPDAAGDASMVALGCSGQSLPTTAPDPVTISGTAIEVTAVGTVPTAGVKIETFDTGAPTTATGTATSGAQGADSISLATGGVPINGYERATKTGYVTSYGFAATPIYQDYVSNAPIVTAATIAQLESAASVTAADGKALLSVRAIDCAGTAIAGATIATDPAGMLFYADNGAPSAQATQTDASGVAYVFDVDVGDVTVSAQLGSIALRSHVVKAFANEPTFADIQP